MKLYELEAHVYETLGNAQDLQQAETQTRWENVRSRAMESKRALQYRCDERASMVALNTTLAIRDGVSRAMVSAVEGEKKYIQGLVKSHIL